MAVQNYIGWATGVTRVIYDSSSVTLGENALKNDELENGLKRSRKRSAFCPDKFKVKMRFNWVDDVYINGVNTHKTEYQLFTEWYKYQHKYGSVPFEFPKILYSQETGITVIDAQNAGTTVEYYKITSSVPGNKSGDDIEVDMDWEAVYGGVVSITPMTPTYDHMVAHQNFVDIYFSALGNTAPVSQQFTIYSGSSQGAITTEVTKTGFYYDGSYIVRVYYDELAVGTWLTFALNYPDYTIAAGTYKTQVV